MRAKSQIERLTFSNFRGATQPVTFEFQPNHAITLIFGENGTGKSTIADAIDFLCNNDFGSLRLRSGTTPRTHIVSVQGTGAQLAVELVYGGSTWRATLKGGKPVTTPSQPPRAFILRRADITRIMEATDSDRYKSLQEFIAVPAIEKCEAALRTLCRTVSGEIDEAIRQRELAEGTLQKFWHTEGRPAAHYLTWARLAAQQSMSAQKQQIAIDKALLAALDQATQAEQQLTESTAHCQQAQSAHAALQEQLHQAIQADTNADLLEVLEAAQSYLHTHSAAEYCPVCQRPSTAAALRTTVEAQLAQLRQIQTLRLQVAQSTRTVQQAEGAQDAAQQARTSTYNTLLALVQSAGDDLLAEVVPTAGDPLTGPVLLSQASAPRNRLVQRIAQTETAVAQHNAIVTHLATIDQLTATMVSKDALNAQLQTMLAVVEEERKYYVTQTVTGISGAVATLYQRLHPDEPLGAPSFALKKGAIGSLSLTSTFGSASDVPPTAYYSEAHLDTLGICVYLALAKRAGNALVVLDDVLTSVDDPHLDRVIELINEEAPHFGHVLITTHSRAWFDRMRQGRGMQAELIELLGWDLQQGMRHKRAALPVAELRSALRAAYLERQVVAARAGILLEQLLDELTLRFAARLPRKLAPEYTLGELADGLDKKLLNLLRCEQFDAAGNCTSAQALKGLVEACIQDVWIRNQVGAHFNPKAAGIADAAIKRFGENVLKLAEALVCPHCQQLPRKNKSGSYWECGHGCGKTRLYPLQLP
jgi:energy-coupling factor transporter ATP-binding protein EcfA2